MKVMSSDRSYEGYVYNNNPCPLPDPFHKDIVNNNELC